MLQFINKICFKNIKKSDQYLLSSAGLIVFSPMLLIKQPLKVVSITIIVAVCFCLHCIMSDIYAVSGLEELEKNVKSEKEGTEQISQTGIEGMEKVLSVDDSEAFPVIEKKTVGETKTLTEIPAAAEGTIVPKAAAPAVKEKEVVNEWVPLFEKGEEPVVSVTTEKNISGRETLRYFNLGVYHQKQGNIAKAVEEYENVLNLDPDNAEAHNNLGVIFKEQGDLDKAVEHFQQVVSLNPGMDEAHNNLGVIHYLRGDTAKALTEYRKALGLNPDNLMSRTNLGLIYKAQGQEEKAIDTLEEVLSEEPFHPEAHYNLAILYEGLGHLEKAVWHYSRFIDNADRGYTAVIGKVSEHIENLMIISGEILPPGMN